MRKLQDAWCSYSTKNEQHETIQKIARSAINQQNNAANRQIQQSEHHGQKKTFGSITSNIWAKQLRRNLIGEQSNSLMEELWSIWKLGYHINTTGECSFPTTTVSYNIEMKRWWAAVRTCRNEKKTKDDMTLSFRLEKRVDYLERGSCVHLTYWNIPAEERLESFPANEDNKHEQRLLRVGHHTQIVFARGQLNCLHIRAKRCFRSLIAHWRRNNAAVACLKTPPKANNIRHYAGRDSL